MASVFILSYSRYLGKNILAGGINTLGRVYLDVIPNFMFMFLSRIAHPALVYWVLSLVFLFLSMFFSYKLFSLLTKDKNIAFLLSLVFSFSNYYISRVTSFTFNLFPIFLFPLFLLMLEKSTEKSPKYLIILFLLPLLFSVYYFYFVFVVAVLTIFLDKNYIGLRKYVLIISLVLLVVLGITFKGNIPLAGNYSKSIDSTSSNVVYRPLEDWYNLSFRPWYFFIPPKSSVFFGYFSKNFYKKIENTNYYLADDYMEEEMAGSYMGWHFLLGMGVVAVLLLLKKFKNIEYKTFKSVYENKEMITRSFFIIFCILLISGPPSFTVRGIEVYTPTYLLYYIIPVFRTLVRWAVVIYLFVLIINSFLVQDLYNLMKTKFQRVLFILAFLTLNFIIFAIKIPVININKPPEEIAFLKEKYPESVPYAVYPKGDYYSIFWIVSHEDLLINPVDFVNNETGFNSNEFSKNLITKEGINEFLSQNPKYLIYYPDKISDDDLEKITKINPELKTREDIAEFFEDSFGEGVGVGESVIFNVGD